MAKVVLDTSDVEKAADDFDDLTRAGERTGTVLDSIKKGASGAAERTDRVGGSMIKLRGALSTLNPQAATFAGYIDDGADALEGMGRIAGLSSVSLGLIAAPMIAFGAALYYANQQVEAANALSDAASARATRYQAAAAPLASTLDDLSVQEKILSGEMSEGEAASQAKVATFDSQRTAARKLLEENVKLTDAARRSSKATRDDDLAWVSATKAVGAFDERTGRARDTLVLMGEKEEIERKAREAATASTKARSEAERRLAEDLRMQAAALKASAAAMDEDARLNDQAAAAAASLRAATRAATNSQLEDVDRLKQAYSDEWDAQEALYQKGVAAAGANDAELKRLNDDWHDYRVARNKQANAEIMQADREAAKAATETRRTAMTTTLGQAADIADALSSVWEDESGNQTEASKRAAKAAVLINAAVAVMKGFAELGPVGGFIGAAAIGIQTTAALKEIESAHQGRVFGDQPDEVRILRQEVGGVLNSQAVRQYPGAAQAMNSGTFQAGPSIVELRVGDTVQRAVVRGQLNGNTDLTRAMRTTAATVAPGMTGRGAAA